MRSRKREMDPHDREALVEVRADDRAPDDDELLQDRGLLADDDAEIEVVPLVLAERMTTRSSRTRAVNLGFERRFVDLFRTTCAGRPPSAGRS